MKLRPYFLFSECKLQYNYTQRWHLWWYLVTGSFTWLQGGAGIKNQLVPWGNKWLILYDIHFCSQIFRVSFKTSLFCLFPFLHWAWMLPGHTIWWLSPQKCVWGRLTQIPNEDRVRLLLSGPAPATSKIYAVGFSYSELLDSQAFSFLSGRFSP